MQTLVYGKILEKMFALKNPQLFVIQRFPYLYIAWKGRITDGFMPF